jgi:hypothetical protein
VSTEQRVAGHAFLSYVREDSAAVDRLQRLLEAAGIRVWRDIDDLWPGEDWRGRIRGAITDNALAFIVCFSSSSVNRTKSYQNEELLAAIDQLRLRRPGDPWLIPVRFDDCVIPELDIGGGRTLASIQRADLFGDRDQEGIARLVASVLRILGQPHNTDASSLAQPATETVVTVPPAGPQSVTMGSGEPHVTPEEQADPGTSPDAPPPIHSARNQADRSHIGLEEGGGRHESAVGRMLISLSGASPEILRYFPQERAKYVGYGSLILATTVMGGAAVAFALRMTLAPSVFIASLIGLLAGLFIMILDRWLIVSTPRSRDRWRDLTLSLPRILVGIVLSILIATPLVLQILRPEINQEIPVIQEQRSVAFLSLLANSALGRKVQQDHLDVTTLENAISNAKTGSKVPVATARSELPTALRQWKNDQAEQDNLTAAFERNNTAASGLPVSIDALNALSAHDETVSVLRWLLLILFALINLLPILVKTLQTLGPASAYEMAVSDGENTGLRIAEVMRNRRLERIMNGESP